MTAAIVFLFGLVFGSLANVCIYRLPKEESIIRPRSRCPKCDKLIPWFDNIPVLSFIFLKGRCRFCREKISLRYPTVELLNAVLFLLLFLKFGLSVKFFCYSLLTLGLVISTFIDFQYQIIPDEISIGGMAAGLILSLIFPLLHDTRACWQGLLKSFLGLLAGGGIIYVTGVIGDFIFKKESMGGGDVKLMAMVGAFLGWQKALLVFFIAPFFGAVVGVYFLIKKKTHVIAYGPYLSLAAIIVIFFYQNFIKFLFGF